MTRHRLNYWIDQISFKLKELDPDCRLEVTFDTEEDNDAYITVTSLLPRREIIKRARPLVTEAMQDDWFILIFTQKAEESAVVNA